MEDLSTDTHDDNYSHIFNEYSSDDRFYHNKDHLRQVLIEWGEVEHLLDQPYLVCLALWYHDIVTGKHHEFTSAAVAGTFTGLSTQQIEYVMECVRSTFPNDMVHGRSDLNYTSDIDMSILGKSSIEYDIYKTNIRREYMLTPYPMYNEGRTRFLRGLMDRPSIYKTRFFRYRYESQAIYNINTELQELYKWRKHNED